MGSPAQCGRHFELNVAPSHAEGEWVSALNLWWDSDPSERYWMEITDRQDLGTDLLAPQADDAGRAYWSYNLVTDVRDGDVILHWHKSLMGTPGIVGWSTATGAVESSTIVWQARGTAGRQNGASGVEPAWRMPLTNYTPLLAPVDQNALRREERTLRKIHDDLAAQHGGPLYFPFAFSDLRPVRTAQGYLVKFPASLLDSFDELSLVPRPTGAPRPPRAQPRRGGKPHEAGYQQDARVRAAIETHAVMLAVDYFTQLGYAVANVGNVESFDLLVTGQADTRHVEVKGSSGRATTVELTDGEVRHATEYQPTDLFVVDHITWWREPDGSVSTDGGTPRVLHDWAPTHDLLTPTRYRYQVPKRW